MMGKATRDAYGEALKELGAVNPDIVVLDADLSASTKTQVLPKHIRIVSSIPALLKEI